MIIKGKKKPKSVIGVEIQNEFVKMANRTKKINGFGDDINFIEGDLKSEALIKSLEKADVITVNPPYKLKNAGIVNPY